MFRAACKQDPAHKLCVQHKTPDDGQRNCPKHVEFYSKNKFEKLVHLLLLQLYNSFVSFGLLDYFFPFLPLLCHLFPVIHSHLPQVIPHVVVPSYSWPSLRSCCIWFPFVYGISASSWFYYKKEGVYMKPEYFDLNA